MKTDNSYLQEKIQLRLEAINNFKNVHILDCFAGKGILWDSVKKKTNKDISIIAIEKDQSKNQISLIGDNLKYLKKMDLNEFDIIDLDAYGIPFEQLLILFQRDYQGIVIVTAIQSVYGALPKKLLLFLGYSESMINKIPTLFYKKGLDKLLNYLYINDIKEVTGYFTENKSYFYFRMNKNENLSALR